MQLHVPHHLVAGRTLGFLTGPFRQNPELQLSCLNKPQNSTSVFIRWKSVWCALTGGFGDLPLPIMASATIGGVPPTHTSAAGYLLGKLLHDGNGESKVAFFTEI